MPPIFRHADGLAKASEHLAVKQRDQRRALAAGRDIPTAEIGNHVNARKFSQQGGIVELQRVARAVELLRPMAHGLAMRADGRDAARS